MAPPISAEQTAQRPTIEEPIVEDPSGPKQTNSQTIVPEQIVEERAKPSMSASSAKPAEGNTSASRVTEQTKESGRR